MPNRFRAFLLLAVLAVTVAGEALAEEEGPAGLVPFARGAYLHQFTADIRDGGRYSVDRAAFQAGPAWIGGNEKLIALGLSYRYDGYGFSGGGTFGGGPWGDVDTLAVSLPIKWPVARAWTVFCIPQVRASAEHGAAFEDAVTFGGLIGTWWTCLPGLKIGPGVGIQDELQDDPSFYPVLLIDWQLGKGWSIETGSGLGATQGPGLVCKWKPNEHWELSLGGRFDRLRFRLDNDGIAPGGLGEETAYGLVASARYWFGPMDLAYVGLSVGLDLAGELALDDAEGHRLATQSHDPTFSLGFVFGIGF